MAERPQTDPTPIFEFFRGSYGSELLTAAIAHFDLFGRLENRPMTRSELGTELTLEQRPTIVLTTALLAMNLLTQDSAGRLSLTPMAAEHLVPGCPFDVGNYVSLAASSPGVLEMVERLKTNQPAGLSGDGAAFIYRSGIKSAMEQEELAEHFTLALSGRAKNVAPALADVITAGPGKTLLDVGAGTGIYSIACLDANPVLTAFVLDRPEVLKTARAFAHSCHMAQRMEFTAADMFTDELPNADIVLLSNILHDWDVPECRQVIKRCTSALNPGGRLVIHDVLLNDALDGPLPVALYSAALFTLTEGRAYSASEYQSWMSENGLTTDAPVETLVHCHALVGHKAS